MSDTNVSMAERNIMSEILYKIKENLILVIIILALSLTSGLVYVKAQKPVYTAGGEVNYIAKYLGKEDDVRISIDIMRAYVDSMVDLCTTGVVLDRADYYYGIYLKSGLSLDDFIDNVKKGTYDKDYYPFSIIERDYYTSDMISVSLVEYATELDSFLFHVTCTTKSAESARDMFRIFVNAADIEGRDYFDGVKSYIYELVNDSSDVKVSKVNATMKNLVIFGALGLVVAVGAVFIKTFFDSTAKDKNELEKITGIDVLAYIEKQEEDKDVKKKRIRGGRKNGK